MMPKTGYFFDAIDRQEPIDDSTLKLEDNLEEFGISQIMNWNTGRNRFRLPENRTKLLWQTLEEQLLGILHLSRQSS